MPTYIMVSAYAYTALRCAAKEDFARRKKKAAAHGQISKAHADIQHDIIKGKAKAFMVRLFRYVEGHMLDGLKPQVNDMQHMCRCRR